METEALRQERLRTQGRRLTPFLVGVILLAAAGTVAVIPRQDESTFPPRWRQAVAAVVVAGLLCIPPVRRAVARAFHEPRHLSPARRHIVAFGIAIMSGIYLYSTAVLQHRAFVPLWHDEQQFLIQTQMLARGRLWMPAHELADFFDTFYVLVRPVYAAQSFPGAALMNLPTVWLHLPTWAMPLIIASAVACVFYLVVAEFLGDFYGGLGVLLLLGVGRYRMLSLFVIGHLPVVLLGLLVFLTYLRWRRSRRWGWAIAMGVAGGWAGITRPLDALCFVIPIAAALVLDLRSSGRRGRRGLITITIILISASPFGALQMVFNKGVTGNWFQTPFDYYNRQDMPALALGQAGADLSARPRSPLPQKQILYRSFVEMIEVHRRYWAREFILGRVPMILNFGLPSGLLAGAFAIGILGLGGRRYWVLWTTAPLFAALYCLYPVFLIHYVVVASPALIFGALLSCKVLIDRWPDSVLLGAIAPAVLALGGLLALPELSGASDHAMDAPLLTVLPEAERKIERPAVILFRFGPHSFVEEEPVYNWTVAWPDDAAVIHAHDLGPRNIEIFRYYARLQPQRTFYLMDRDGGWLKLLGTAAQLAQSPASTP
jgi:hypothetical protein